MIERDVLQAYGAKEMMNLINTFECLPIKDINEYFAALGCDGPTLESELSNYHLLYYDNYTECILKCKGLKPNPDTTAAFETMVAMANGKKLLVGPTLMPGFDYVFMIEGDSSVYQLMIFGSDAKDRLKFYNASAYSLTEDIPVFVFANSGTEELFEKDGHGEEYLVPRKEFYTSSVEFRGVRGEVTLRKEEGRPCLE